MTKREFKLGENGKLFVVPSFEACPLQPDEDALDLCIRKWETVQDYLRAGQVVRSCGYSGTCALCHTYLDDDAGCLQCPIYRMLGAWGCDPTPFTNWEALPKKKETIPLQIEFVQEEIELLEMVQHWTWLERVQEGKR